VNENGEAENEFERDWAKQAVSLDHFMMEVRADLREIKETLARIKRALPDQ